MIDQDQLTTIMFRGRMRLFRITLLQGVGFSKWVLPQLLGDGFKYVGAFHSEMRQVLLWQNAIAAEDKRMDHNALYSKMNEPNPLFA